MEIRHPSSTWCSLSYLVLHNVSILLLSILDVFMFYTTIIMIYFHTCQDTHITKETLQRSKGNLPSCSLRSWHIPPTCISYNTENQGMVTMGYSIHLANLCTLLISTGQQSWVAGTQCSEFQYLNCAVSNTGLGPSGPLVCQSFPAYISPKPVVLTQDPIPSSLEFLLLPWKSLSSQIFTNRTFGLIT